MNSYYTPAQIPLVSAPVTSANIRNARNHPAIDLGACTPFELLSKVGVPSKGTLCLVGNPARSIDLAKVLIRRAHKPFLFLGTAADRTSAFAALAPEWTQSSAAQQLPRGNGAIYFSGVSCVYGEICEYLENWTHDYFVILHLGQGALQAGAELLNCLNASEQCLLFCDSVSQSIRAGNAGFLTAMDFVKRMSYLFVFSSGSETQELMQLFPKYTYEQISNTETFNSFSGRSILHPFNRHRTRGVGYAQMRTQLFKKDAFEQNELKRIFDDATVVVYNGKTDDLYLTRLAVAAPPC